MESSDNAAVIGILMLESRFPRLAGDIGHPLLRAFIEAAQALVAEGVDGTTTSCEFLAPLQAAQTASIHAGIVAPTISSDHALRNILCPTMPF